MFDKIGLREPLGVTYEGVHVYLENGMHYERLHDYIGLIVAADHEDVGQVTFYRLTVEDWNGLVDGSQGEVSGWITETDGSLYAKD